MDSTSHGRSRLKRPAIVAGVVVGAVVLLWLAAWGVDAATSGDASRRNLEVLGTEVGGLDGPELAARVNEIAASYGATAVRVESPDTTASSDADTAGLSVDTAATIAAIEAVDDDVAALARPVVWLSSLFTTRKVAAVMEVDEPALGRSPLAAVVEQVVAPTEPSVTADGATLVVVPGSDGSAVTLSQLAEQLKAGAEATQGSAVDINVEPQPLPPQYSDADAQVVVDLVNLSLGQPITVVVGEVATQVDGPAVASWLTLVPGADGLDLGVDPQRVIDGMNELNSGISRPEVPERFAVVDGTVTTSPGTGAVECCDPASTVAVVDALTTPARTATLVPIEAPLKKGSEWAASLGIVQPVGTFTTRYPAGQDRAINIVRIAEILRGTVIEPGTTFSVNQTTGPRTEAEGFVPGGIIVNGKLSSGVGGGISQYATTLFNAAFFAGLDIPDFMMHTLYISRYPYGREATLAWPTVDLKITNNTPYGILIWSESTPESITVTLYSTPWIVADQTGQVTEPVGACTKVTTERTRRWLVDNRTETDVFIGRYQPEEGVLC
jgi:vancomycin resistance protein YoaR